MAFGSWGIYAEGRNPTPPWPLFNYISPCRLQVEGAVRRGVTVDGGDGASLVGCLSPMRGLSG